MRPERDADPARYEALLATVERTVRAPDAERAIAEDAPRWLADGGLDEGDVDQLAAFGARRLTVYRRHVRGTLARAVRLEIPRTAARLGEAFTAWVNRWIEEAAPSSRYFRDVAFELVAWAAPRWMEDPSVPSYLGDLARHELAHFEVATAPHEEEDGEPSEITLDRRVRFAASARLLRYDHAVHRLDADLDARDVPVREPTALLAYRDVEHDVRYLELTPLAAAILESLLRGDVLRDAVVGACARLERALDAAVLEGTAAVLTDLVDRRAIVGGEA